MDAAEAAAAGPAVGLRSSFTFADFDGDRQPDLATAEIAGSDAHITRYLIRLQFAAKGASSGQSIGVTGSYGQPQISARDVNGDNVPDLVVTASGQQRPIAILLNDGRGRFSLANPSDFPSSLLDAPSRWRPANRDVQDAAVLLLVRSPQAGAVSGSKSFVPQTSAPTSDSASHDFVRPSLRAAPSGRAPPRFASI